MSELRYDLLDDRWTLYAPGRAARPHDVPLAFVRAPRPAFDPLCPFCPGNEDRLAGILFERRGPHPEVPWATRVVPNKYPIVSGNAVPADARAGLGGSHEVVIETPRHDRQLADMATDEIEAILDTYRGRFLAHAARAAWTVAFRNHGPSAGISLVHAHGHVLSTLTLPPLVEAREWRAERFFSETGRCHLCEALAHEQREGGRLVRETDRLAAFVPYAAEVRFELWVVPRRHCSDFAFASDAELVELGSLLKTLLGDLRRQAGDPDYNFVILSATATRRASPAWHWLLRLRPRTTAIGGFELASGVAVNPSLPEIDAAQLRGGQ
jgi:UDPglucose--hexose-1-phosphate uridylyltransferase